MIVGITRAARKQLLKVPRHVAAKLLEWMDTVEEEGLEGARTVRGYRDEALVGDRKGQRSVRLSRSYRAVYVVVEWETVHSIRIEEVSKHDY